MYNEPLTTNSRNPRHRLDCKAVAHPHPEQHFTTMPRFNRLSQRYSLSRARKLYLDKVLARARREKKDSWARRSRVVQQEILLSHGLSHGGLRDLYRARHRVRKQRKDMQKDLASFTVMYEDMLRDHMHLETQVEDLLPNYSADSELNNIMDTSLSTLRDQEKLVKECQLEIDALCDLEIQETERIRDFRERKDELIFAHVADQLGLLS